MGAIIAWVAMSIVYGVTALWIVVGGLTGQRKVNPPMVPTPTPTPYVQPTSYEPANQDIGIYIAYSCNYIWYPKECQTWCWETSSMRLKVWFDNNWRLPNHTFCTRNPGE